MLHARAGLPRLAVAALTAAALGSLAAAADTLNAYSIWPENWARPMFQEFEGAPSPARSASASWNAASTRS